MLGAVPPSPVVTVKNVPRHCQTTWVDKQQCSAPSWEPTPFIQALLCFKTVHFQNPFFTFGQNRLGQSPSFLFAPDVCISLFNLTSLLLSLSPHPPSFFPQIFLCLLQSKNCAISGDKTVPRIQTRILSTQEKVLKILTLIISYWTKCLLQALPKWELFPVLPDALSCLVASSLKQHFS